MPGKRGAPASCRLCSASCRTLLTGNDMTRDSMTRDDLASVLDEIALLLELKGDNSFKIRAYKQGAETVRSYDGDIFHLAATNQLDGIKGIGEALRDKLHELATTGTLAFHQQLRAEFPPGI